jgi:uncharacterized protein YycO
MKKKYKIAFFTIISIIIIVVGIMFVGLQEMAIEDKHIDVSDLKSVLEEGDIIFQTSKSEQSKAIQKATNSKYSHMGIIYFKGQKAFVFEAVQPVKLTAFDEWINRGEGGHYAIKRLKNAEDILTPDMIQKMKKVGEEFIGKNYDIYFEWSDDKIYCSELVWKIYKEAGDIEIGELESLSDFDLTSKIVKEKLKEKYGDKIPLNEKVISPKSMFNSILLRTIHEE